MSKSKVYTGPYWTKAWIQSLWEFTNQHFVDYDSGKVDFEALGREEYEFRKALFFRNFKNSRRAADSFNEAKKVYDTRLEAGVQGGRPSNSDRRPTSRDEFHAFVYDEGLHQGRAEEWYAIHEARDWKDQDGNRLVNWRGALVNYCKSREKAK